MNLVNCLTEGRLKVGSTEVSAALSGDVRREHLATLSVKNHPHVS